MASLAELQHDIARADTTAAVLAAARDAFAYTLDLTKLCGHDSATFWAAPVMAGAVAADGRDAVAFAPSLPPGPRQHAPQGVGTGRAPTALSGERSQCAVPREHGSAARDAADPDDASDVNRPVRPQPAPTDAPAPEASPTALVRQPWPGHQDALATDGTRSRHDAARPRPAPARSASYVAAEISSGAFARMCQTLAARLNAEAARAADAADRAACRRAAVYAAEIAALLPGYGP